MARPENVCATADRVLAILERYTMFPWPLLKTQAERAGLDPSTIDAGGLRAILDELERALVRFTSPEKGAAARKEIEALLTAP